ncbi:hypothetical protein WJX74_008886 [Apatococcus lobatus]|uniref:Uncharacterized protein n=2 Tax=Apatococcus TaxID=904362 RepID=A0AAW1ST64_9CHLO
MEARSALGSRLCLQPPLQAQRPRQPLSQRPKLHTTVRSATEDSLEALSPVELKDAKPVELTDSLEEDGKCRLCGAELNKAPWSCDRLGREVGGIGAVPGFKWWPIKAYRPCPSALKAGVKYVRKGQITDDVLFGRRKQRTQQ